ncbi:MAG: hypothetical protein ACRD0W_17155 [Acidimicrobiales bacterium]
MYAITVAVVLCVVVVQTWRLRRARVKVRDLEKRLVRERVARADREIRNQAVHDTVIRPLTLGRRRTRR